MTLGEFRAIVEAECPGEFDYGEVPAVWPFGPRLVADGFVGVSVIYADGSGDSSWNVTYLGGEEYGATLREALDPARRVMRDNIAEAQAVLGVIGSGEVGDGED